MAVRLSKQMASALRDLRDFNSTRMPGRVVANTTLAALARHGLLYTGGSINENGLLALERYEHWQHHNKG